jgi:glycerophosphoryl diester phosphodiesterase
VILPGQDASPDAIARFRREAQAAAGLAGHPGIVGVHDIGEAEGKTYFAMDLVEGKSLEQLIEAQFGGAAGASDGAAVPLDHRRTSEIVEQAARAGLLLGVWTVNEAAAMKRFIGLGVGVLITDRADLARELLKR